MTGALVSGSGSPEAAAFSMVLTQGAGEVLDHVLTVRQRQRMATVA